MKTDKILEADVHSQPGDTEELKEIFQTAIKELKVTSGWMAGLLSSPLKALRSNHDRSWSQIIGGFIIALLFSVFFSLLLPAILGLSNFFLVQDVAFSFSSLTPAIIVMPVLVWLVLAIIESDVDRPIKGFVEFGLVFWTVVSLPIQIASSAVLLAPILSIYLAILVGVAAAIIQAGALYVGLRSRFTVQKNHACYIVGATILITLAPILASANYLVSANNELSSISSELTEMGIPTMYRDRSSEDYNRISGAYGVATAEKLRQIELDALSEIRKASQFAPAQRYQATLLAVTKMQDRMKSIYENAH